MNTVEIDVEGKKATGIEVELPGGAMMVMLAGSKGYIMCGLLNIDTAEKLGQSAAIIRGIKNVQDLLEGKIVALTASATASGLKIGMTGKNAIEILI